MPTHSLMTNLNPTHTTYSHKVLFSRKMDVAAERGEATDREKVTVVEKECASFVVERARKYAKPHKDNSWKDRIKRLTGIKKTEVTQMDLMFAGDETSLAMFNAGAPLSPSTRPVSLSSLGCV